jgi:hypothetical protein
MILEILAEITFVSCLGNGILHLGQFHGLHLTEFGYEFIVTFL